MGHVLADEVLLSLITAYQLACDELQGFEQLIGIFDRRLNNQFLIRSILSEKIGLHYLESNDEDYGILFCKEALKIYKKLREWDRYIHLSFTIAMIYRDQLHMLDKALKYSAEAQRYETFQSVGALAFQDDKKKD